MPHSKTRCWSGPKEHRWYPGASLKEKYHIAFLKLMELVMLILYHMNFSSGATVCHIPPCTLLGYPQYFLKDFFSWGFLLALTLGSRIRNMKSSYMRAFVSVFSLASETLRKLREIQKGQWVMQGIEWVSGIANYFSNIINWAQWYHVHPSVNIPVHQLKHSSCYHVLLKEVRGWYVCNLESYVFYNVNILWGNRNITLKM